MESKEKLKLPNGRKFSRDEVVYIIIDVQNDFTPQGKGELQVPGEEEIVVDQKIIDNLKKPI